MGTVQNILFYLVNTLGGLYIGVLILRFLLQAARADFYNPISQSIVTLSNPAVKSFRKIIPGIGGLDLATLVAASVIQFILGQLVSLVAGLGMAPPLVLVLLNLCGLLMLGGYIIFFASLILVVTSFIAPQSRHPILLITYQLLDPILRPLRRIIPPMGGLDFSVLLLFIGLTVGQMILLGIASSIASMASGLPWQQLVIGL